MQLRLGRFLADRASEDPLPEVELCAEDGTFEWNYAPPLEKVIRTQRELDLLLRHPELYQTALAIVEPWNHIGVNEAGETVRASKNIAFIYYRDLNGKKGKIKAKPLTDKDLRWRVSP
ncbi:hypothetical protein [Baaleninema simplex]|uniref:hypothetical protein n=1 Tax=Baaleninema simplex TaxID=2862350 RepID=UPI0003450D56|nr:hypothetical protein [Baaleninema simplex]